jgi:hypothetical protein
MDRDLERLEAALGAVAKITGDVDADLIGARCPKCDASDFVHVPDVYSDAVGRLEEHPDAADVVQVGGLTDRQIVGKLSPPRRKSVVPIVIGVAVPLGAAAAYLYRRFGDTPGQFAILVAIITVVIVLWASAGLGWNTATSLPKRITWLT